MMEGQWRIDDDMVTDKNSPKISPFVPPAPHHFIPLSETSSAVSNDEKQTSLSTGNNADQSDASLPPIPNEKLIFSSHQKTLGGVDAGAGEFSAMKNSVSLSSRRPPLSEVRLSSAVSHSISRYHHHPSFVGCDNEDNNTANSEQSLEKSLIRVMNRKPATPASVISHDSTSNSKSTGTISPTPNVAPKPTPHEFGIAAGTSGSNSTKIPQVIQASSKLDKSRLYPTFLDLRNNVEESNRSLYLFQEENKALKAENLRLKNTVDQGLLLTQEKINSREEEMDLKESVNRLKEHNRGLTKANKEIEELQLAELAQMNGKLHHIQEYNDQLQTALVKELAEKEETMASLTIAKEENESLSNQLLASKAQVASKDKELQKVVNDFASCKDESLKLKSKLKGNTTESAKKLKKNREDSEAQMLRLKDENKSFALEIDRLKAMVKEADQRNSKLSQEWESKVQDLKAANETFIKVDGPALREEIDRLNLELQKCELRNKELLAKQKEDERTIIVLHRDIDVTQMSLEEAEAEKQSLLAELAEREETGARATDLLNEEIGRLVAKLNESGGKNSELEEEIEFRRVNESNNVELFQIANLEASLDGADTRDKELVAEKEARKRAEAKVSDLVEEIKRLELALKSPAENKKLSNAKKTEQTKKAMTTSGATAPRNSLFGRLGRIQDGAERRALVQNYRREVTRMKVSHESELKRLLDNLDEEMKEVDHKANIELNEQVKEYTKQLQMEHETKILDLQLEHQQAMISVSFRDKVILSIYGKLFLCCKCFNAIMFLISTKNRQKNSSKLSFRLRRVPFKS